MIVDDEVDVISSVKQVLEYLDAEYNIVGANSAKECLKLLDNGHIPDVILLDIMMPEMNGWALYTILKDNASWKNIPIVFLTARIDRIAKGAGEFLGDDYITKPFEIKDLKKRIDNVLNEKIR